MVLPWELWRKNNKMSLLDLAVQKCSEQSDVSINEKRTLLFAGSKGVGKTSLIQRFLDRNDVVKETLALEYSFGRKSGRSLTKDICHVWELGGGVLYTSVLPHVLRSDVPFTTLVIMVDLSDPFTLWHTLETILQTVYSHVTKCCNESIIKNAQSRFPDNHEDKDFVNPFPIPLLLIGGKHDLFEIMDPETKKQISRTLREVTHYLAGSLVYYSDKDAVLVKRMKDVLNHYGFGGSPWKNFSLESNKALAVPCGLDSFQQMQVNVGTLTMGKSKGLAIDLFRVQFVSKFPQKTEKSSLPIDPSKDDNFKEPLIDSLRQQRDEEVDRIQMSASDFRL